MKFFGIDLSVILIALITAYIGYQFNVRSKKREAFLKELSTSYNEIYSPMHEQLTLIMENDQNSKKLEMIDSFIQKYSEKDSKIRFIASSYILEYFYKLRIAHLNYIKEASRKNEKEVLTMIKSLHSMIEDEFWNAHDIIYADHKQFISDAFKNPIFVILGSAFKIIYHLSVFLCWVCAVILYFTISHMIIPIELIPKWWNIYYAMFLLALSLILFWFLMMFKEMMIKKNRRESRIVKNFKVKIKELFKRKGSNN